MYNFLVYATQMHRDQRPFGLVLSWTHTVTGTRSCHCSDTYSYGSHVNHRSISAMLSKRHELTHFR